MESHHFIHMRTILPLSTAFDQKEDDFSSTSSSPILSAEFSRSNSYDDWMNKRSLSQDDEDVERKELLANSQIKTTSLEIGRMSTFALVSSYFLLNLALTFYNKYIMIDFPFPYFITALHAGSGTIGCLFLRGIGVQFEGQKRVSKEEELEHGWQISKNEKFPSASLSNTTQTQFNLTRIMIILFYSTLYAANIAISNASLRLVSVPFHQIIRSTCPIFTLVLGFLFLADKKSQRSSSLFALIPIVLGAAFACFGDVNATTFGFILTVLGTFLAALKTVVTNVLQGGHKELKENQDFNHEVEQQQQPTSLQKWQSSIQRHAFHYTALELLEVMSPLACVQCLLASQFSGELRQVYIRFTERTFQDQFNWYLLLLLFGNGFTAFLLNIISFKTNKIAGPLTMTVVGNLKQVVTILLAFQLFHLHVQTINIFGIFIALFGTAWYGIAELNSKQLTRITSKA